MHFVSTKRYPFVKIGENNSETVMFRTFLGSSHSKLVKLLILATPGCAGFSSGCQGIAGMT